MANVFSVINPMQRIFQFCMGKRSLYRASDYDLVYRKIISTSTTVTIFYFLGKT